MGFSRFWITPKYDDVHHFAIFSSKFWTSTNDSYDNLDVATQKQNLNTMGGGKTFDMYPPNHPIIRCWRSCSAEENALLLLSGTAYATLWCCIGLYRHLLNLLSVSIVMDSHGENQVVVFPLMHDIHHDDYRIGHANLNIKKKPLRKVYKNKDQEWITAMASLSYSTQ